MIRSALCLGTVTIALEACAATPVRVPLLAPSPIRASDSEIANAVAGVSESRISQTIGQLAAIGTRNTCSGESGIGVARKAIQDAFDAIGGLTVTLEPFVATRCAGSVTAHDVMASLVGATHPERLVIVGGHYDSRSTDVSSPTQLAPGANDSGSQTALVLETARVLAGHHYDATLVFVAFAGEEQGLVGSAALARDYRSLFPNASIVAMLNVDIVGGDSQTNDAAALSQVRVFSPGTPREIKTPIGSTDDTSPARGLMRYVAAWGSAYAPALRIAPQLREDRPGRSGDHHSFLSIGVPAVRFIELDENLAHQHSSEDRVEFVTPSYTANVTRLVASTAALLARAPAPPVWGRVAGTASQIQLGWTAAPGAGSRIVVAARLATENTYSVRREVSGSVTSLTVSATELGLDGTKPFYLSVASMDDSGHESLFAYPEIRCTAASCAAPADASQITTID
jgi:hypothetical protein